jgi:hypothetical protein
MQRVILDTLAAQERAGIRIRTTPGVAEDLARVAYLATGDYRHPTETRVRSVRRSLARLHRRGLVDKTRVTTGMDGVRPGFAWCLRHGYRVPWPPEPEAEDGTDPLPFFVY